MEEIRIYKMPRLRNPNLIVAWPGMGEVAFKAATYLVKQLKAVEFAQIPSEDFFYLSGGVVKKGILSSPVLPYNKFYYFKSPQLKQAGLGRANDLIIFISNAQPDLAKAKEYSQRIIRVAEKFKVKTIVGFAAMPQPIDHTQRPAVWLSATSEDLIDKLRKYKLSLLNDGQISGMNGLFLSLAKDKGFPGFCLLAEIPLYTIQVENPKASMAVLDTLSRMLGLKLDFSDLTNQVHIMEEEINKFLDYLKIGSQSSGPIGEEDIEKIKRALGQLTKLPVSIKGRIEGLFNLAGKDISRAAELKSELDKWNVYKDYEDRFLDLFRKQDSGN